MNPHWRQQNAGSVIQPLLPYSPLLSSVTSTDLSKYCKTIWALSIVSECCGLNVCAPPSRFIHWHPNPWFDGMRRRDLEAIRSWGWTPHGWDSCPYERNPSELSLTPLLPHEDMWRGWLSSLSKLLMLPYTWRIVCKLFRHYFRVLFKCCPDIPWHFISLPSYKPCNLTGLPCLWFHSLSPDLLSGTALYIQLPSFRVSSYMWLFLMCMDPSFCVAKPAFHTWNFPIVISAIDIFPKLKL